MDTIGIGIGFFWMLFCSFVLVRRFQLPNEKSAVKPLPLFKVYLAFSLVLGTSLIILNAMGLNETPLSPGLAMARVLWFFAWSPVSLAATFFAPIRFLALPVGFIVLSAVYCSCTAFLIDESDKTPTWAYVGFALLGLLQSIGAAVTYLRARKATSISQAK
jgi:hypothetical protein